MRPTPIPDDEIWEGAVRRVFTAPDGDLTNPDIAPVEALIDPTTDLGVPCLSCRVVLEDGDLEKLQAGAPVWVSFYGGAMIPWAITVADPGPDEVPPEVPC